MNKFITGKDLEEAVYDIIWDAKQILMIVSPYVKLDEYFKKIFNNHKNNPKVHLLLVFGKNETAVSRSLSKDDFDFFKQFPFVSIIYVPNLHAKYYGNERKGIVTSINLYDYSFKNNIEFGIYTEQNVLNTLTDQFTGNPDKEAWSKCIDIAEENDAIFIKRPVYEKTFMGLSKNYITSEILLDYTDHFYAKSTSNYKKRRLTEFDDELELGAAHGARPIRYEIEIKKREVKQNHYESPKASYNKERQNEPQYGYCIRTGEQIPFNPARPFTYGAWQTWNQFKDEVYPEKYCHRTGKPSYGKTSMRNPILFHS
ncbi:phospholipase D family protein [Flavobacterium sp. RHBU_24]|uniref:phospholipase D family protein n=1 Tax=Flavobacterium sp. RHBU_24 TaxID=3391185 RepID=UPI003984E325